MTPLNYACVGNPVAEKELADLRKIAEAAAAVVKNPAWAGIYDEDIDLEQALRAGLTPNDIWYKQAHLENIACLQQAKDQGPYKFLATIRHPADKRRYINVFKVAQ